MIETLSYVPGCLGKTGNIDKAYAGNQYLTCTGEVVRSANLSSTRFDEERTPRGCVFRGFTKNIPAGAGKKSNDRFSMDEWKSNR